MRVYLWKLLGTKAATSLLAVVAQVLFVSATLGQLPCQYEFTTWPNMDCGFGPFPGTPVAVNVHGHVTGHFIWCGEPNYRTFLWTGGPTTTILPVPAGYRAMRAESMNDLGEIVGTLELPSGTPNPMRAFLRRANGQVIDLGLPRGATMAWATAINNKSEITGYCNTSVGYRPFVWKSGALTILSMPNGSEWAAFDIDEQSRLLIWRWMSESYLWSNGDLEQLALLRNGISARAVSIAANGNVGGTAVVADPDAPSGVSVHAVLWRDGEVEILGTLPGHFSSEVDSINDSIVVGTCGFESSTESGSRAFVWSEHHLVKLSDLVAIPDLDIYEIGGITDDGRIACVGYLGNGGTHMGLLLTPTVPVAADVTADCRVNVNDLLLVINEWGKNKSPADINRDSVVNILDLLIVIENWTGGSTKP